ncbi:Endolysin [Pseudolycoriella hygida]|uniref:Endolysin n=1 Tax=Pseudolycoriella hygida TaxID=35572 RepID=A0A9Q0MTN3_9DIPT|nr:Endolysin [Pseudolycoriella hygida]
MELIIIFNLICLTVTVSAAGYNGPTNQAGLNLIKKFEGWYPNFYLDPTGIKTIGYGHACHVWNCAVPLNGIYNVPLSAANGEALLKSDLVSYEKCVSTNVKANINANQFSALSSFVFNLGCGNFKSSDMLRLLNAGDVKGASDEMLLWVKAGGKVLQGLVNRRAEERNLFCSGGVCASSSCVGKVTATSLYIRASASSTSASVGSLTNGQSVTILGRVAGQNISGNSNWFKISNGYISAYYITITSSSGASWCAK